MTSPEAAIAQTSNYAVGDVVPFHFNPGIVIASFFVSLLGAVTTMELLQRRTYGKGWSNWLQLGSCACSLGLVAIWCMHYVGNRAIIMGEGQPNLQLLYDPGFTALSSVIPVLALLAAFSLVDRRYQGWTRRFVLLVSGLICGAAIAGMHYSGTMGVANYAVDFSPSYTAGAIIIACAASVAVMTLISNLQRLWMNILPCRVFCAVLLATAVCSMHFLASIGTAYHLKQLSGDPSSQNTNFIVAIVLSLNTIPICVAIAISTARRKSEIVKNTHKVVLACARFSPSGMLMVTSEGLLPYQEITIDISDSSLEHEFNNTHPAFQWMFRVSHNWACIARFLPSMRRQLSSHNAMNDNSLVQNEGRFFVFREGFCVAASNLACQFEEEITDLGTLYDHVLMIATGNHVQPFRFQHLFGRQQSASQWMSAQQLEASSQVDQFGKGQLLLLIKECSDEDVTRLTDVGHCFVLLENVVEHLARTLRISVSSLTFHLRMLKEQITALKTRPPKGTILGCFALRAGVAKKDWDVLVLEHQPHMLPYVPISLGDLTADADGILEALDGLLVADCMKQLDIFEDSLGDVRSLVASRLKGLIRQLASIVAEPFFEQAVFASARFRVPTYDPSTDQSSHCEIYAFHVIPDIHRSSLTISSGLVYTPLSLLQCRQKTLHKAPQHSGFEQQVHHEFNARYSYTNLSSGLQQENRTRYFLGRTLSKSLIRSFGIRAITSTKKTSIRKHGGGSTIDVLETGEVHNDGSPSIPFGGILVSKNVKVETGDREPNDTSAWAESVTRAFTEAAGAEENTYVDDLCDIVFKWYKKVKLR